MWIALIGWFVFRNASLYDRLTTLQEALLQLVASDAMTREFRVVDANQTLRSLCRRVHFGRHADTDALLRIS
jgi:hypothetical protein